MYVHFLKPNILDLVDIAAVTFLFYRLLVFIQGTRAQSMLWALLIILFASLFSQAFDLGGLNWFIGNVKTVWVVAFFVLFQPEIRRALTMLGRNRFITRFLTIENEKVLDEVVDGATKLAEMGIGGLIVLEGNVGLRMIIETGTLIQANVSSDLITTIFTPNSPLHDGAVIIRKDELVAAGCILPLTQNPDYGHTLGTRHRAGIGITEESDSTVIIVSEERHHISLAYRGVIEKDIDRLNLKNRLKKIVPEQ
jgi:diadenylate cyclase